MSDWEDMPDEGNDDLATSEENASPEPFSYLNMIRRFIFQTKREKETQMQERIAQINASIEQYPESAGNYLLRGEIRREMRFYELARDDFLKAIELAEGQFAEEHWGMGSQVVMDKARTHLHDLAKYLD